MNLTTRGWGVVAVVGVCLLMAAAYGSRALNALVAPLFVVLLGAVVTVYRTDRPTVRREPVPEGFAGEVRTVTLEVDVGAPTTAVVHDEVEAGLAAAGNRIDATLTPDGEIEYDVRLERRGEHAVGPTTVTVHDVLGIAATRYEYAERERVLVYPDVRDLRGARREDLQLLADAIREYNREEFSHIREYERGDSLRDVHWKSTAKRADDELVVKEFVAEEDLGTVELVAESTPGAADEMATAAASVATHLLEMDVAVGVTAPEGRCEPDSGREHHQSILRSLARTGPGRVTDRRRERADVVVEADEHGTTVVVDEQTIPFGRLCGRGARRTILGAGGDGSPVGSGNETGDAPRSGVGA